MDKTPSNLHVLSNSTTLFCFEIMNQEADLFCYSGGGSSIFLYKAKLTLNQSSFEVDQTSARREDLRATIAATSRITTITLNFRSRVVPIGGGCQSSTSLNQRYERVYGSCRKTSCVNTPQPGRRQPRLRASI